MKIQHGLIWNWEEIKELTKGFEEGKKFIFKKMDVKKVGVDKYKAIIDLELEK